MDEEGEAVGGMVVGVDVVGTEGVDADRDVDVNVIGGNAGLDVDVVTGAGVGEGVDVVEWDVVGMDVMLSC